MPWNVFELGIWMYQLLYWSWSPIKFWVRKILQNEWRKKCGCFSVTRWLEILHVFCIFHIWQFLSIEIIATHRQCSCEKIYRIKLLWILWINSCYLDHFCTLDIKRLSINSSRFWSRRSGFQSWLVHCQIEIVNWVFTKNKSISSVPCNKWPVMGGILIGGDK